MKIPYFIYAIILLSFLLFYNSNLYCDNVVLSDTESKIVKIVFKKVIEDYEKQKSIYPDDMPSQMSIAQVAQKYNRGNPLNRGKNIIAHWLYRNGSLSISEVSSRENIMRDKTYPPVASIATFAIFTENDKILLQLDEQWFAQNGYGFLYEVVEEESGDMSLKLSKALWIS